MTPFGVVARPKAPKGYKGVWINIYFAGWNKTGIQAGGAYNTKDLADATAKPYRHDCVYVHVKDRLDKLEF